MYLQLEPLECSKGAAQKCFRLWLQYSQEQRKYKEGGKGGRQLQGSPLSQQEGQPAPGHRAQTPPQARQNAYRHSVLGLTHLQS
ncbi:hypothetical protein E2C01_096882 [Portunus trituberculatus]|uniref:Uncharacterized protein n=1 Tax=Portunus trituberculatus TaxID=210409 RepID=A0A5B7K2X9_PORTR|nr:hypothetical protein [Portunus trituberculatus]